MEELKCKSSFYFLKGVELYSLSSQLISFSLSLKTLATTKIFLLSFPPLLRFHTLVRRWKGKASILVSLFCFSFAPSGQRLACHLICESFVSRFFESFSFVFGQIFVYRSDSFRADGTSQWYPCQQCSYLT